MKSDLISRSELFNRLADKHTKAEFYQVINDMPTEEVTLERACEMLAEFFDAPCNYTLPTLYLPSGATKTAIMRTGSVG